ncbi:hypothetical protein BH10PAT2_BH10PAT2_1790 [soil metagenome]
MKKSAQTKKKVVKKSMPMKKVVSSPRVMTASKKNVPWHQKQFMMEHQERLHQENPALRTLLYVMLAAMIVLIALLFIQGQAVGIW